MIKNIIQIPSYPRTGSTYLNHFISIHGYYNLNEFLSILTKILPNIKTKKGKQKIFIIKNINIWNLYKQKKYKLFNELILNNWNKNWYYKEPVLINGKLKTIKKYNKPLLVYKYIEEELLTKYLNILNNLKQPYILKMFPSDVLKINDTLNINILSYLNNIQYITSSRSNILDVCISLCFAEYTKIFNLYNNFDETNNIKDKFEGNCYVVKHIFNELNIFNSIIKNLPNVIEFNYDTMFRKNNITNKLNLKPIEINENLTRKLYPTLSRIDKLNLLKNKKEFLETYIIEFIKYLKK